MPAHKHKTDGITYADAGWRELRCACGAFYRFPVAEPTVTEVDPGPYPTGEWITDHDRDLSV